MIRGKGYSLSDCILIKISLTIDLSRFCTAILIITTIARIAHFFASATPRSMNFAQLSFINIVLPFQSIGYGTRCHLYNPRSSSLDVLTSSLLLFCFSLLIFHDFYCLLIPQSIGNNHENGLIWYWIFLINYEELDDFGLLLPCDFMEVRMEVLNVYDVDSTIPSYFIYFQFSPPYFSESSYLYQVPPQFPTSEVGKFGTSCFSSQI